MPYFEHAFENENLNSHCAGFWYLKMGHPQTRTYFKAVAFPNEKFIQPSTKNNKNCG